MMTSTAIAVPGYLISNLIYDGSRSQVYRGQQESNQQPVAIKILKSEYPTFTELVKFYNQYAIAKNLTLPGVIQPYSLENYRNGFALVMEDMGGISLNNYTREHRLELVEFLLLAIQIAQTFEALYHNRVIHKDIKPHNILINPETKQVKLIDFSIASLLPRETQKLQNPKLLEGTLAYMSPEQTGRMNRGIDYRTDFYSLGVTFYELLTGQLPFNSTDPMELVHGHIARIPTPPSEVNPAIPQGLSDIIMKLMSKNAEDRYQSAFGLRYDLEKCWQQWEGKGNITRFSPGIRDISDRFQIPEKLYGREREVETLLAAFERVAAGGAEEAGEEGETISQSKIEMMLVAGFSGIGKTALVSEIHKPIVRQGGYFIKGKFDQFKRNIPFSALVIAFSDLIRQLLAEGAIAIKVWKTKILDALGENGQVIINVIPELELLIGNQPTVPELEPSAAQNRFNLLFQKFIRVFPTSSHPLVIFLDDLQWVDSASLKLLQLLMSDSETEYLLLIGAYRDNEVNSVHPLMLTLDEIRKTRATINQIMLASLKRTSLNRLISDTLFCSLKHAKSLTDLIQQKTQGNPFFVSQFLKSLHEDGLISFDFSSGCWQCDMAKVRALSVTDDVVEFMALQLQKLPETTQTALKLAACIGNQFDLETLAIVYERTELQTAIDLWKALQSGLVLPLSEVYKFFQDESGVGNQQSISLFPSLAGGHRTGDAQQTTLKEQSTVYYKFLHDRVQQAAYFLIPDNQKQATHLKIGQLLLKNTPLEEREEKIFDIVNQLNYGIDLITRRTQRDELAQLNLIAGRKAKASTAYAAAVKYLTVGIKLLKDSSWQSQYDLILALYVEAAEAEYLNTNFEQSERLMEVILQKAKTLLDKVKVYELKMQIYTAQNQLKKAINIGLQALELLGISLSTPPIGDWVVELPCLTDLGKFPEITDPYQLAAMRILVAVVPAAYWAKDDIFLQIILTMVNLCIEHGHSAQSAYAYVIYGLLLCGTKGNMDAGYYAGELAIQLLEQFDANSLNCKVNFIFNGLIRHWKEHARNTSVPLRAAIQSGLDTGDLEYTVFCATNSCFYLFFIGEQLESLEQQQAQYISFITKIQQESCTYVAKIWRQLSLNLIGKVTSVLQLSGDSFDEAEMLPYFRKLNNHNSIFHACMAKGILSYLFQDYQQAMNHASCAEESSRSVLGSMSFAVHKFYYSLILLAQYKNASLSEQRQYLSQVATNQEKMKLWAHHAPANYKHKYDLVEAERARVLGNSLEAIEDYDRAIAGAKENEYINEEALANELAAKFYLDWGKDKIAQTYLIDAYYGYVRWGAKAKVEDLEKNYPQLLTPILQREKMSQGVRTTLAHLSVGTITSTSTKTAQFLELSSVLKASQAIAGEIVLDKLLSTLMQGVIENAGAEKGVLILQKEDGLAIEAMAFSGLDEVTVLPSIPVEFSSEIPISVVNYVHHTGETLVIDDATSKTTFAADSYIIQHQSKSILCTPVINQSKLIGILYLENNLMTGAFTSDRLEVLILLCSQAAISLENARLYQKSQDYAHQLKQSLQQLRQAQMQLIQNEKMSTLGQLVAVVAHEINNPINFISGNLPHADRYIQNLLNLLHLYQQNFPCPGEDIEEKIQEFELEYLVEDLPNLMSSMKEGTKRILNISTSLKTFSHSDTSKKISFNVHEGIDSTIMILKHQLKANDKRPTIEIIQEYGNLPLVPCYPGQLNQVFMNIITNAIDALVELNQGQSYEEIQANPNRITIRTEVSADNNSAVIRIADNGAGMAEEVKQRVFDHFFTTKAVGQGTGLGLSISRQIVEETHGGKLTCVSAPGQGTEFAIALPLHEEKAHNVRAAFCAGVE